MQSHKQKSRALVILVAALTLFAVAAGSLVAYGAGFMLRIRGFRATLAESFAWAEAHDGLRLSAGGAEVTLPAGTAGTLYWRVAGASFLPVLDPEAEEAAPLVLLPGDGARLELRPGETEDELYLAYDSAAGRHYRYLLRYAPGTSPYADLLAQAGG